MPRQKTRRSDLRASLMAVKKHDALSHRCGTANSYCTFLDGAGFDWSGLAKQITKMRCLTLRRTVWTCVLGALQAPITLLARRGGLVRLSLPQVTSLPLLHSHCHHSWLRAALHGPCHRSSGARPRRAGWWPLIRSITCLYAVSELILQIRK